MMESATYLASQEIAERSGTAASRYRTADGRFVLNDRDLARVRLTADEYVGGLAGIEKIGAEEAQTLIARNGFAMGLPPKTEEETEEEEEGGGDDGGRDTDTDETATDGIDETAVEG